MQGASKTERWGWRCNDETQWLVISLSLSLSRTLASCMFSFYNYRAQHFQHSSSSLLPNERTYNSTSFLLPFSHEKSAPSTRYDLYDQEFAFRHHRFMDCSSTHATGDSLALSALSLSLHSSPIAITPTIQHFVSVTLSPPSLTIRSLRTVFVHFRFKFNNRKTPNNRCCVCACAYCVSPDCYAD